MLECSICKRLYDARFTVFVPPHTEPFDTIECARRAAAAWDAERPVAPIVLPTIEAFRPDSEPTPAHVGPRVLAALAVLALAPAQAALAGGAALLAGGTAASAYLAAKPSPGALASKPIVRRQGPSDAGRTSPQVPTTSVVTRPADVIVRETPAGSNRGSAPRRAERGTVARHAAMAVAQDEGVAERPSPAVPRQQAAPQRPPQAATEPQAATPTPEPMPKSEAARSKSEAAKSKPEAAKSKPETAKSKPETAKSKPETAKSKSETARSKPETAKSGPETAKSGPETAKSKPETPKPAPSAEPGPAAPDSQPPPSPSAESRPPTDAPADDSAGPPGQEGNHGKGKGGGH